MENLDNTNSQNAFDQELFSWEAPEYIKHEKGAKWFVVAGLLVFLLCVYSATTSNWTLLIALIVLSTVYVWQHLGTPQHIKVIVSKMGIKVGNKQYPYNNIDSFWIIYRPPHIETLNLKSNVRTLPDISIKLGDVNPGDLRAFLSTQIKELEGKDESFMELLIRIFKL